MRALSTHFESAADRWNDGYGRGCGSRDGFRGGFQGRGRGRENYRGHGRGGFKSGKKDKRKSTFDLDKYCRYCQIVGHDIHVCQKYAREQKEKESSSKSGNARGNNSAGNGNSGTSITQYQLSYAPPSYCYSANTLNFTVNVTRLIANSTELVTNSSSNDWIVDSAANAYVTPFRSDFDSFEAGHFGEVKGFAGKREIAQGKGSVTLTDCAGNRLTLHEVAFVPDCEDRILSLMKFRREHQAEFRFTGLETFVITTVDNFCLTGHSVNDILYTTIPFTQVNVVTTQSKRAIEHLDESESPQVRQRIRTVPPSSDSIDSNPVTCSSPNLWHLRYGHASSTTLRKLKRIRSTFDSFTCIPCIEAKKTRQPFPSSDSKVTDKLSQIHSDICGQYPELEGNSIYNLTFLNELTHHAWTRPILNKVSSTVAQKFSQFVATVERETGLKIKCLRTDEGEEYQGYLTFIIQVLGIKHETTPPHTPQLNGKAERLNCTLNEAVRAMLYQANMPQSF